MWWKYLIIVILSLAAGWGFCSLFASKKFRDYEYEVMHLNAELKKYIK